MKMMMAMTLTLAVGISAWSAKADAQDLTGKQKDACGAVLCLAALGSAPSECSSYLRKYYSISASRASKLRQKRKDFLNQCPSNAPGLVDSLVRGNCNPTYQACTPADGPGGELQAQGETKAD